MVLFMVAMQHHAIPIVSKDNSVLSEGQSQLVLLIVEMVLLLELKLQQEDAMIKIKYLEMDVINAMLNHYGHVQDNLQSAHSNAEMVYFNHKSDKHVMMEIEIMVMVVILFVKLFRAGVAQVMQDLYHNVLLFVEMVK
jgi:hypothetical protein